MSDVQGARLDLDYVHTHALGLGSLWANFIRGHPFITFAKFSGFWTPSPLVRILG